MCTNHAFPPTIFTNKHKHRHPPRGAAHNSPSPKAMRLRNCNTAGNGNITAFISIPYCAKHDLPSPTDSRFLISGPQFPIPDSQFPIPDPRFLISDSAISDSQFPIPDSQFPVPNSRFPIPNPQFQIPNSRFPIYNTPSPTEFRFPIYSSRVSNMVSSGRGV